ncbi:MAG: hypothetical protein IMZ66_12765 [Planctomycetes bacterium]|nr:hypothetical protein [Planctomycetota bacterium]
MSLINDALKRADASRPAQTPPADKTPAAPVQPHVAPVPVATWPSRPRRRGNLAIILVAGVLVIGVAAGISHLRHGLAGPKQALAKVLQLASAIRGTGLPATTNAIPENPVALLTAEAAAPAATSPEALDAGRTVEEWPAGDASYEMLAVNATRAALDLSPEEAGQTLALPVRDGAISLDADAGPPGEAASDDADAETATFPTPIPAAAVTSATAQALPETPEPAKAQAATPPATPTTPPRAAAKDSAGQATFDTSKYRVSSIVVGPGGATALVNGRPVRIGDALGDGRVVAITVWTVEVDCGGRRSTLRR